MPTTQSPAEYRRTGITDRLARQAPIRRWIKPSGFRVPICRVIRAPHGSDLGRAIHILLDASSVHWIGATTSHVRAEVNSQGIKRIRAYLEANVGFQVDAQAERVAA